MRSSNFDERGGATYHCSHTPDVCAGTPFRSQNYLRRPVLPCLNVIREVVINPAGVA